jgi:hypothetical protein
MIDTQQAIGRIVLKQGLVHYAEICSPDGEVLPIPPSKAIYRILTWETGLFELDAPTSKAYTNPLDLSAQAALMEGFRQKDELSVLQVRLPPPDAALRLKMPLEPQLSKLSSGELDVLQLVINSGSVSTIFDTSPQPDLETAQALVKLIESGYVGIVEV